MLRDKNQCYPGSMGRGDVIAPCMLALQAAGSNDDAASPPPHLRAAGPLPQLVAAASPSLLLLPHK